MQQLECFVTPYWVGELSDINNDNIANLAYKLRDASPEKREVSYYRKSPTGLKWRSYYLTNSEIDSCPDLKKVISYTLETAKRNLSQFNPVASVSVAIDAVWFNISGRGEYIAPHIHPGHVLFSTYYPKAPKNCGNLVLMNPNDSVYWTFPPGGYMPRSTFTDVNKTIEVTESLLFMGPGYIQHYVEPNESDEDRISVAINFRTVNSNNVGPNDRNFVKPAF